MLFLFEVQPDDGLYGFFTLHRTHLFLVVGTGVLDGPQKNKRCISLGCGFGLCIDTVSFKWEPNLFRRERPSVRCKAKRRYDLHRCLTPLSFLDYSIADGIRKVNSFLLTFSYLARLHKREPKPLGFDSLYIIIGYHRRQCRRINTATAGSPRPKGRRGTIRRHAPPHPQGIAFAVADR